MTIDTRDDAVVRLRPRPNLEVNRHFICDTGRADYRWMNRGDRAEAPLVRDGDRLRAVDWDAALDRCATLLNESAGPVVVLAGGRASCETLGGVMQLVAGAQVTAAMKVPMGAEEALSGIPDLALRAERAANLEGARLLGVNASWASAMAAVSGAAMVIVIDVELDDAEATALAGASHLAHFATIADPRLRTVDLVLPVTTMAEEQGVYVNRDRRAQRYLPARPAPGMARPAWWVAGQGWARRAPGRSAPATASEAFGALAAFGGMTYRELGMTGRVVPAAASVAR
jgi:NADH-quinone oxidoreductase subunit G